MTPINLQSALPLLTRSLPKVVAGGPAIRAHVGPGLLPRLPPQMPAALAAMWSSGGARAPLALGGVAHARCDARPLFHCTTDQRTAPMRNEGFAISRATANWVGLSSAGPTAIQKRSVFTRVEQPMTEGRVLYHGTSERRAERIRSEGFDVERTGETTRRGYARAGEGVYLTTSRGSAEYWGAQADQPRKASVWDDAPAPQTEPVAPPAQPRVAVIEVYPPDENPAYRRIVVPWDQRGLPSQTRAYIERHPGTHEAVVASGIGPGAEEEVLLTKEAAQDPEVEIRYWVPQKKTGERESGSGAGFD